jgi:hypothetical protein
MRTFAIVALLAGTATAGPVVRVGAVGGYDTAAPGHREDGIALGLGYRYDGLTAELDYAYLDYDGSTGIAGGTQRMGVLGQARLLQMTCAAGEVCPHLDLDVGAAQRWVRWTPSGPGMLGAAAQPTTERRGRELMIGASANFGWHLSLHYVLFQPDEGPQYVCRGTCPMRTTGNDTGLLLEASFAFGG